MPSLHFNVQSALFSLPFWTSAYLCSASTSNLPRLLFHFGLPRDFPLLQRPIHRVFSSLLDFLMASLRFNVQSVVLTRPLLDFLVPYLLFNVQSAAQHRPFWTSAYLPSASTSNPPCLPHHSNSPLVHRKKGVKKLTLPHSLFPMDQRGVEPLSENPFPVLLLS